MDAIASYVMTLVCGAVICSIILSIGGTQGAGGSVRRMVCGLFMAFLAISPLRDLDLGELPETLDAFSAEAEIAAQDGVAIAEESVLSVIKSQTEAYILDKAGELGLEVEVSVLVEEGTRLPVKVIITGSAAPYQKQVLNDCIRENLGIEGSAVQWVNG